MASSKGARTGGLKEKPKSASTIRLVELRDELKESVKGMCSPCSCLVSPLKMGASVGFG